MSGHSKWANIKRQKEAKDKEKGQYFSKLSRLITLAVIESNGITDPEHNFKLRLAIDKAKVYNMPKDNINRAIEKGIGPEKSQLKEVVYEGFAGGGVALIILATTDNPNRTLSEVRNTLEKNGGKLASQGAVHYLFKKLGQVQILKSKMTEESIFALADKLDAFDVNQNEDSFIIDIPFENIGKVKDNLGDLQGISIEVNFKAGNIIKPQNKEEVEKIVLLIKVLEELDDVYRVYTNCLL